MSPDKTVSDRTRTHAHRSRHARQSTNRGEITFGQDESVGGGASRVRHFVLHDVEEEDGHDLGSAAAAGRVTRVAGVGHLDAGDAQLVGHVLEDLDRARVGFVVRHGDEGRGYARMRISIKFLLFSRGVGFGVVCGVSVRAVEDGLNRFLRRETTTGKKMVKRVKNNRLQ